MKRPSARSYNLSASGVWRQARLTQTHRPARQSLARQHCFSRPILVVIGCAQPSPQAAGQPQGCPTHRWLYGAIRTTSYALRPCDDNMYCNDARASYFIQLSSLRHVGAQHTRQFRASYGLGAVRRGDREGRSHEILRDSAGIFHCALQRCAIVVSAMPRLDYCRDEIAAREPQRSSALVGVRNLRSRVLHDRAMGVAALPKRVGAREASGATAVAPARPLPGA
jgi:hypothetical protein